MDESKYDKRIKIVNISYELVAEFLRLDGTKRIVMKGLPADAVLLDTTNDLYFNMDILTLKFWSSEFPLVAPGCACEELIITTMTEDISKPKWDVTIEEDFE